MDKFDKSQYSLYGDETRIYTLDAWRITRGVAITPTVSMHEFVKRVAGARPNWDFAYVSPTRAEVYEGGVWIGRLSRDYFRGGDCYGVYSNVTNAASMRGDGGRHTKHLKQACRTVYGNIRLPNVEERVSVASGQVKSNVSAKEWEARRQADAMSTELEQVFTDMVVLHPQEAVAALQSAPGVSIPEAFDLDTMLTARRARLDWESMDSRLSSGQFIAAVEEDDAWLVVFPETDPRKLSWGPAPIVAKQSISKGTAPDELISKLALLKLAPVGEPVLDVGYRTDSDVFFVLADTPYLTWPEPTDD